MQMSELNLKWASQEVATDLVATYLGLDRESLLGRRHAIGYIKRLGTRRAGNAFQGAVRA